MMSSETNYDHLDRRVIICDCKDLRRSMNHKYMAACKNWLCICGNSNDRAGFTASTLGENLMQCCQCQRVFNLNNGLEYKEQKPSQMGLTPDPTTHKGDWL